MKTKIVGLILTLAAAALAVGDTPLQCKYDHTYLMWKGQTTMENYRLEYICECAGYPRHRYLLETAQCDR